MGKNGAKAKNQLVDFIELSKRYFCPKWLKTQIGEGIDLYDSFRFVFANSYKEASRTEKFTPCDEYLLVVPHEALHSHYHGLGV
jgi:hypothetical protein